MKRLEKELEKILNGDILYRGLGICENIIHSTDSDQYDDILEKHFRTWEHFSGDIDFPVPDPEARENPQWMFSESNLWEGEYGALRLDLARHILTEIRKGM